MSTAPTRLSAQDATAIDPKLMESVLLKGDLKDLTPAQRLSYYNSVCQSLGLNPITRPFEYLILNGRMTLYAKRECTDQLRKIYSVSTVIKAREAVEGCYIVTAKASFPNGREDESIGAVPIEGVKGEARANAMMKAETKAKRRATLSICGLAFLDETEVDSIRTAQHVRVSDSGEILGEAPEQRTLPAGSREAAAEVARQKLAGEMPMAIRPNPSDPLNDPTEKEKEKTLAAIKAELDAMGLLDKDKRKEYREITTTLFGTDKWTKIAETQIGILTIALQQLREMRKSQEAFAVPEGFPSPFKVGKFIDAMHALKTRMARALGTEVAENEYTRVLRACGAKSGHSNDEALQNSVPAMNAYRQMLTVTLTAEKMLAAEAAR